MNFQGDPYTTDRTPVVSILVNGKEFFTQEYMLIQDVLNLGDPFSCTIPNPDGLYSQDIVKGASLEVYMADPDVAGGKKIRQLKGLVTQVDRISTIQQGTKIRVSGADLGWHLQTNTVPLARNRRLAGISIGQLVTRLLDSSWGFGQTTFDKSADTRLKLGRSYVAYQAAPKAYPQTLPIIQFEPGETCADVLIRYCKMLRVLVNVTSDGNLVIWSPDDSALPSVYRFTYRSSVESGRQDNNLFSVNLTESADGNYTQVDCYSQVLFQYKKDSNNPNEGQIKGSYTNSTALPFVHRLSFPDGEQWTGTQVTDRARWKAQRALFDSWTYTVETFGHSQNGVFFTPNTVADVDDTVTGINGRYYVSAVKMSRNAQGTKTEITLKPPGLLRA